MLRSRSRIRLTTIALLALAGACTRGPASTEEAPASAALASRLERLPTGRKLDPAAAAAVSVDAMPLAAVLAPDGRQVVISTSGYITQGLQVVDRETMRVTQTVVQPSAFVGLAWSPDGGTLYASGGTADVVYMYGWSGGRLSLRDSVILAPAGARGRRRGRFDPAGLALSPDGKTMYVAGNEADSLAVADVAAGRVTQRIATGRFPYAVAVAPDGTVYVSDWGASTVSVFAPSSGGTLAAAGTIEVGRHPSALLLTPKGDRLFVSSASTDRVAVVGTAERRVLTYLVDTPPHGVREGSTPDALALSPDGTRLYVAEADDNAIALFDLSAATSGVPTAAGQDTLAGRVPTDWYPSALVASGDTLIVATGKGHGTAPNPLGPNPATGSSAHPEQYTLGQLRGTVEVYPAARTLGGAALDALSRRVALANRWNDTTLAHHPYPPIEHVIYVIKENRTYDEVLGDLPQADGDSSLLFFSRAVGPNHHALAERFGIFDRFFVNAEVSADGHNWSTAAYATDYLEKTVATNYSERGRSYDYEGTNRGHLPPEDDDVNAPAMGYLWDQAARGHITFRNYGEYVIPAGADPDAPMPSGYEGDKPFLRTHTNPDYPGFDLDIPDQHRADVWIAELQKYVAAGQMPQLEIVRLPNDHTKGAAAGQLSPRAYFADNDLALGRMIEALSKTPFWKSTAVFVLEDDAQNGPDHVDSHRSPLFVISPWMRPGVYHRFANTTDVILTIEELLGLGTLSQFDHFGHPLDDIWAETPDVRPYTALVPQQSLDERNPRGTKAARESRLLKLEFEDQSDDGLFNRILWAAIKGDSVPYPGVRRAGTREVKVAR